MKTLLAFCFCLFAMIAPAWAQSGVNIEIENAWSRSTAPGLPTGVVYFTIHNRGTETDTLLSASSTICSQTQLHESLNQNGVMVMRPLESAQIAPGGSLSFETGGKHVMLIGLKAPLITGTSFPLTLTFEKAGAIETTVSVKGEKQSGMPMGGMDMNAMDHQH